MKWTRDSSVECYRTALMFGLVLLHVIDQGGHCMRGCWNLLRPCLVGFVFISGYYGIRFSVWKIVKLAFLGVWCAFVSCGLGWFVQGSRFDMVLPIVQGYWFLWAYIALMCFAPVLNSALGCDWRNGIPIFCLVFGWSYLVHMPYIKSYVPGVVGFGPQTVITLVGVYTAARIFRISNLESRISTRLIFFAFPILVVLAALGFSHYHSLISLGLAAIGFIVFRRLPLRKFQWIRFVAPSLLSIYFLHQTRGGLDFVGLAMHWAFDVMQFPLAVAWIVSALMIFLMCFMLDTIRRCCLVMLRRG